MANLHKEDLHHNKVLRSFQLFFAKTTAGGIVLIIVTALAMFWANSQWADTYKHFWNSDTLFSIGSVVVFHHQLSYVVNDALMVIFFFLVGLEIKRELLVGELSTPKKALLPVIAAIGGVIGPMVIYSIINFGEPTAHGWAIPMATDIAFSLGILSLAGDRVPLSIKVFLAALAIVDDLMAVLVIAFFFTSEISFIALFFASLFLLAMFICNRLKVNNVWIYLLFGVGLWYCFLISGIHATIAGVIAAFTIPSNSLLDKDSFFKRAGNLWDMLMKNLTKNKSRRLNEYEQDALGILGRDISKMQSPLIRLEHSLNPYVAFIIMPIFALANAGVYLGDFTPSMLLNDITLGVTLGLLVGKIIGITTFVWLFCKLKITSLPDGVNFSMIFAVSILCAIGFTMALFIANLSFHDNIIMEEEAKIGILLASFFASIIGVFAINKVLKPKHK